MIDSRPPRASSIRGLGAHDQRAAAELVAGADAVAAEDGAAGREVRPRHVFHELRHGELGIVDQRAAGVDHLAEIVRRDVGRHADGDAARAVDQQVGIGRRQDRRLLLALVVVRLELDRVLVDVGEQRFGGAGQTRLGVAHGRRRIAVHRAEIALPGDQRQAHGEVLRHAHHGVVDRGVAVRVILAHHVADDAGGFAEGPRRIVAAFLHGVEDAAVHRLQPVARIGQRARHDHAHRVIEVGAPHLLFDGDRRDIVRRLGGGGGASGGGGGGGRIVSSLTETWFFARFYGPARGPGGTDLHPSKTAPEDQQKTPR